MKLLLFLPAVRSGGAERVMVTLAHGWIQSNNDVSLVTINPGDDFYEIDDRILRVKLDIGLDRRFLIGPIRSNFQKIQAIRKTIKSLKPDVIVSFMNRVNIRVILAATGLRIPVIISERIAPEKTSAGFFWRVLRRITYPLANAIITQTDREADWFKKMSCKTFTIQNPVSEEVFSINSKLEGSKSVAITAMGRFSHQKGFDLLIHAFHNVLKEYPDSSLTIYGDGNLLPELKSLVADLRIQDKICLPGVTCKPYVSLAESDIFVLSSRYEGFPNVLIEAMGLGLAVVAFDCPNGPKEIIKHEQTGILVNEITSDDLSEALIYLLKNPQKIKQLGINAALEVREKYSLSTILEKWDIVFSQIHK